MEKMLQFYASITLADVTIIAVLEEAMAGHIRSRLLDIGGHTKSLEAYHSPSRSDIIKSSVECYINFLSAISSNDS